MIKNKNLLVFFRLFLDILLIIINLFEMLKKHVFEKTRRLHF
jgi:hypothetical protein